VKLACRIGDVRCAPSENDPALDLTITQTVRTKVRQAGHHTRQAANVSCRTCCVACPSSTDGHSGRARADVISFNAGAISGKVHLTVGVSHKIAKSAEDQGHRRDSR